MSLGVDALGFGRGTEQARDVGETVLLGFDGESAVFLVRLALAGECLFEIICRVHIYLGPYTLLHEDSTETI
jgi:hypothetical protein